MTSCADAQTGGLLATFVSSASIVEDAPRVVIGIAKQHRTWELIEASGAFALHLLRDDARHCELASRFGLESARDIDKFAGLSYFSGTGGSPILEEVRGWLDCRVETSFDTGDRTLYLGAVLDASSQGEGTVLTVKRWVESLNPDQKARLGALYGRDAATDAEAIRHWRANRTPI